MSFYPPKINEHFINPQHAGEIIIPSAVGTSGSFVCGAALKIYLAIEDGIIKNARFKAAGCGFLMAAAEMLCRSVESREFAEIGKAARAPDAFFSSDFEKEFPGARKHCRELAVETLQAAVNDYRATQLESWQGDEALICTCFGVSEKTIETAIETKGLTTVEEVTRECRAGGGCGSCQPLILDILEDVWRGEI